jgi:hypothetical protein
MADIYTLYALDVGGVVIDQIKSYAVDPGIQHMLISGDSSLDHKHVSVQSQTPTIRFRTDGIKKALNACGVGGLAIDEAGSINGIDVWFRKRDMAGGFAAGASHIKMTVNLGVLAPITLTGNHPDAAEIEYVLSVLWDGTNDPIVITKNQSLAALSPDVAAVHTIGPWWVRGTKLVGMRSLSVDFGLNVETKSSDGDVWPRSGHIVSRAAGVTGQTTDLVILDDTTGLGIMGKVESGGTRAFLRKKEMGGGVVLDASAEHIRFTMAEGMISPQEASAEHQGDAIAGLQWVPTFDDVNAPIAYAADVAVA